MRSDEIQDDVEAALAKIGGDELVARYLGELERTDPVPLPAAYQDGLSTGYTLIIGGLATAVDLVCDHWFRVDMANRHELYDPERQWALEKGVKRRMRELGVEAPGGGRPSMAIDHYGDLNAELGLKTPFRLRPRNHRLVNHTDPAEAIEMLRRGEVGLGELRRTLYPKMSGDTARELFRLHIEADLHTPQSLPLRAMSWLWRNDLATRVGGKIGPPSRLFQVIQALTPGLDWAAWANRFAGAALVPEGATVGDAMLKLYDAGVINQRSFWTSDLGAAVGGLRRRALISGVLELGVDLFALFEGLHLGHLVWDDGLEAFGRAYGDWVDQPKYLSMRSLAQATASAGPLVRATINGDVLGLNFASLGLVLRHLWVRRAVTRRHTARLVQFSRADSAAALDVFTENTGIKIACAEGALPGGLEVGYTEVARLAQPVDDDEAPLVVLQGGLTEMSNEHEARLREAGCCSTRVRVLAERYPEPMADLVVRIAALSEAAQGDDDLEARFDAICELWYLGDLEDDDEALRTLTADIEALEKA